jgi:hypothetical protein
MSTHFYSRLWTHLIWEPLAANQCFIRLGRMKRRVGMDLLHADERHVAHA